MKLTKEGLRAECERQIQILLEKEYPQKSGMSVEDFLEYIADIKKHVEELEVENTDLDNGYLPFVIVVKSSVLQTEKAMSSVLWNGKHGLTKLSPRTPNDFIPISTVQIPVKPVYIIADIDRGKEFLNVRPADALVSIQQNGRSPLTIDEGIAIITHFPEFLVKNNCFSLLASRFPADKRVPAIWINGEKHPNLGWCWNRNPHTWLGSVSCKVRV